MKVVYWVGGVVIASVIGYVVWKMLDKHSKSVGQAFTDQTEAPLVPAAANGGNVINLPFGKKVMFGTGLGGKKGFIR